MVEESSWWVGIHTDCVNDNLIDTIAVEVLAVAVEVKVSVVEVVTPASNKSPESGGIKLISEEHNSNCYRCNVWVYISYDLECRKHHVAGNPHSN